MKNKLIIIGLIFLSVCAVALTAAAISIATPINYFVAFGLSLLLNLFSIFCKFLVDKFK